MKNQIFLLALSLFVFSSCCGQGSRGEKANQPYPAIQALADSVQKKYVPDRRVDVFDVEVADLNGTPILKGFTSVDAAKQELLELARKENAAVVDSLTLLPDAGFEGKTYGVITLSVATLQTKASYSAEMATQALMGMPVQVLQKEGWWRIRTADGYIGWTPSGSFQQMTKDEFNAWTSAKKIVFTSLYGMSYQDANENSPMVSDLVAGDMMKLEGDTGRFYKVSYPDGRIAYVLKQQSKPMGEWLASLQLTEENIIKKARTMLGVPYIWGATSTKAVDCSGFTKTIFFLNGVILSRDASQQAYTGIPVDISNGYSNLRPGDLMFFGQKAENGKKERVGHVAIYIGNNEFIHSAGRVKINSLDSTKTNYDKANTNRFIRAARVIGAVDTKGIWSIQKNPMYQVQE